MRTFEGQQIVRYHKNLSPDVLPLTIDCENEKELVAEQKRIKKCRIDLDGAIMVTFNMSERL